MHCYKYNYTQSVYVNSYTKLQIVCPIHGEFWQRPNDHMRGVGCKLCGKAKQVKAKCITFAEFVIDANRKFGNKFSYNEQSFTGYQHMCTIVCPDHGNFTQTPMGHMRSKHGCPVCSGKIRRTQLEFISESTLAHSNKYSYSKVKYVNTDTKVTIGCPDHGDFAQTPYNHKNGAGCPKCAGNVKLSTQEFIDRANATHSNKYTYTDSKYIGTRDPITITCTDHGNFTQLPNNHLSGAGCPSCANVYGVLESQWLNSLNIPGLHLQHRIEFDDGMYAIADGYDQDTNTVYEFNGDFWHGNPLVYLPDDVNPVNKKTFRELHNDTVAKIIKYKLHGYNVVEIWESEYRLIKDDNDRKSI